MPVYKAPVKDTKFVLNDILHLEQSLTRARNSSRVCWLPSTNRAMRKAAPVMTTAR
jgi:hypothetical protein